jgi:Tfp pilus assembly protein PilO
MKFIFPIILIIIAGVVFFVFTDPILNTPLAVDPTTGEISGGVFPLLSERSDLNTALSSSDTLREASKSLVEKYNNLSESERTGVDKLLPDRIDNVQLVIDINSIASKYGMTIKNIKIGTEGDIQTTRTASRTTTKRATTALNKAADISFTVTGSYNQLRNFLTDLGRSLRLVDVTGLSFTAGDSDLYQFNVEVKTYWLE